MLDIGSWEFLLIILVGVIIIGPKDLPGAIRTVAQWVRRAKDLAREFQGGLAEIARDTELDEVKREFESGIDPTGMSDTIKGEFKDAVDPSGELKQSFDFEDDWYSDDDDVVVDGDDVPSIEDPERREAAGDAEQDAGEAVAEDSGQDEPAEADDRTGRGTSA